MVGSDQPQRPARDRDRVAVRADPDEVVARGIGEKHIGRPGDAGEAVRIGLVRGAFVVVRIRVVGVRIRNLVRRDIEDRLDRTTRFRLAIEHQVAADGPAGAVARGRDVGEVQRIGDVLDGSLAATAELILEHRSRGADPALADEQRVARRRDALR